MPIREKRYKTGKYLEVEIYPISKMEKSKSRSRKKKESRKEQRNLNDKNARKNLRRLINNNFTEKDIFLHLTYDKDNLPTNEEEAIRDRNNYLRRVKNYRKRKGLEEVKYISVLEYHEAKENDKRTRTRIHHHIVISGMDRDDLESLWKKGRANADRLQPNEIGFEELANYISKDPRGKRRYSPSRNLKIPEPSINDNKYSYRQLHKLTMSQGEKYEFENLYPGYFYTGHTVYINPMDGRSYILIKMRKLD